MKGTNLYYMKGTNLYNKYAIRSVGIIKEKKD